jgi:hypothetical protein
MSIRNKMLPFGVIAMPVAVSISTKMRLSSKPSAAAKRVSASRCASIPSPDRPCCEMEVRYVIAPSLCTC